jgi:hypothetical protein
MSREARLEARLKERAPHLAECLTLVFDSDASLAEHLDSIDLVFRENGDPLKKVWIDDETGRSKSVDADQAIDWLRQHPGFRTYQVIVESERKNARAAWLSTALGFNLQSYRKTLFLGIPWQQTNSGAFSTHLRLLRHILVRQKTAPVYGFGFRRPYGLGPGSYSMGNSLFSGGMYPTPEDGARVIAWSTELTGDPQKFPRRHRHAKGMILDVFPLNILSDVHLRQLVNGVGLRQWILENTGPESLLELSERCFAWRVDEADLSRLSAVLAGAGLIIAKDPSR